MAGKKTTNTQSSSKTKNKGKAEQKKPKTTGNDKKQKDDDDHNDPNPLQLPTSEKDLLACKECHRILTQPQFVREGCRVCDNGPIRAGNDLHEQTTQKFYGHVGVIDGQRSWIARLIGLKNPISGVYAARTARDGEDH